MRAGPGICRGNARKSQVPRADDRWRIVRPTSGSRRAGKERKRRRAAALHSFGVRRLDAAFFLWNPLLGSARLADQGAVEVDVVEDGVAGADVRALVENDLD